MTGPTHLHIAMPAPEPGETHLAASPARTQRAREFFSAHLDKAIAPLERDVPEGKPAPKPGARTKRVDTSKTLAQRKAGDPGESLSDHKTAAISEANPEKNASESTHNARNEFGHKRSGDESGPRAQDDYKLSSAEKPPDQTTPAQTGVISARVLSFVPAPPPVRQSLKRSRVDAANGTQAARGERRVDGLASLLVNQSPTQKPTQNDVASTGLIGFSRVPLREVQSLKPRTIAMSEGSLSADGQPEPSTVATRTDNQSRQIDVTIAGMVGPTAREPERELPVASSLVNMADERLSFRGHHELLPGASTPINKSQIQAEVTTDGVIAVTELTIPTGQAVTPSSRNVPEDHSTSDRQAEASPLRTPDDQAPVQIRVTSARLFVPTPRSPSAGQQVELSPIDVPQTPINFDEPQASALIRTPGKQSPVQPGLNSTGVIVPAAMPLPLKQQVTLSTMNLPEDHRTSDKQPKPALARNPTNQAPGQTALTLAESLSRTPMSSSLGQSVKLIPIDVSKDRVTSDGQPEASALKRLVSNQDPAQIGSTSGLTAMLRTAEPVVRPIDVLPNDRLSSGEHPEGSGPATIQDTDVLRQIGLTSGAISAPATSPAAGLPVSLSQIDRLGDDLTLGRQSEASLFVNVPVNQAPSQRPVAAAKGTAMTTMPAVIGRVEQGSRLELLEAGYSDSRGHSKSTRSEFPADVASSSMPQNPNSQREVPRTGIPQAGSSFRFEPVPVVRHERIPNEAAGTQEDRGAEPLRVRDDYQPGLPVVQSDGTIGAPQLLHMKQAASMDEIAALPLKRSPERKEVVSGTEVPPLDIARIGLGSVERDPATGVASRLEDPSSIAGAGLFHSISREVSNLRATVASSLAVVLRPDSRTELFLRLEIREGKIEAFARCERGDIQLLNSHWPELQRCLANQGVQLLDLQNRVPPEPSATNFTSNGFAHGETARHSWSEQAEASSSAPGDVAKSKTATSAKKTNRANRLLESWA
jgi:hypothetical protein